MDYLERHITEEMHGGSPGRAALDDLEALGIDTIALRREPPPSRMHSSSAPSRSGSGTAIPWPSWDCSRWRPSIRNLLTVERLVEATGLPGDGFRQLLLHAKLDEHHARELHRVVDTLPLDREQEELISVAALQTMSTLIDAWLDVIAEGAPRSEPGADRDDPHEPRRRLAGAPPVAPESRSLEATSLRGTRAR